MTEPYYADDAVTLWHGDCLDVLRGCGCTGDESVPCEACGAEAGEPCRPMCIGMAAHMDTHIA